MLIYSPLSPKSHPLHCSVYLFFSSSLHRAVHLARSHLLIFIPCFLDEVMYLRASLHIDPESALAMARKLEIIIECTFILHVDVSVERSYTQVESRHSPCPIADMPSSLRASYPRLIFTRTLVTARLLTFSILSFHFTSKSYPLVNGLVRFGDTSRLSLFSCLSPRSEQTPDNSAIFGCVCSLLPLSAPRL